MTKEEIKELRDKYPDKFLWRDMHECLDALEAEQARNARLSEQIDALIKRGNELARFARHTDGCASAVDLVGCTCGLDAFLRGDA